MEIDGIVTHPQEYLGGVDSSSRQHNCPSYSATCSVCGIIGYFSRMCHRRQGQDNSTLRSDYNNRNNMVNENQYKFYDEKSHVNDTILHTRRAPKPYTCNLILNGVSTQFEIDTGAITRSRTKDMVQWT